MCAAWTTCGRSAADAPIKRAVVSPCGPQKIEYRALVFRRSWRDRMLDNLDFQRRWLDRMLDTASANVASARSRSPDEFHSRPAARSVAAKPEASQRPSCAWPPSAGRFSTPSPPSTSSPRCWRRWEATRLRRFTGLLARLDEAKVNAARVRELFGPAYPSTSLISFSKRPPTVECERAELAHDEPVPKGGKQQLECRRPEQAGFLPSVDQDFAGLENGGDRHHHNIGPRRILCATADDHGGTLVSGGLVGEWEAYQDDVAEFKRHRKCCPRGCPIPSRRPARLWP